MTKHTKSRLSDFPDDICSIATYADGTSCLL